MFLYSKSVTVSCYKNTEKPPISLVLGGISFTPPNVYTKTSTLVFNTASPRLQGMSLIIGCQKLGLNVE